MKTIALLSWLLCWPTVVFAEALPVVCQEFPPYNYIGEDGRVTGTSTEILIAVLKRMGYEADIQLLPWNRAYHRAASGEAAILYTFSKNAQREDHFFFTDGLASIEIVFFKRKSDSITWEELTDVKDLRIGYVDGYNYGDTMMEALRQAATLHPIAKHIFTGCPLLARKGQLPASPSSANPRADVRLHEGQLPARAIDAGWGR